MLRALNSLFIIRISSFGPIIKLLLVSAIAVQPLAQTTTGFLLSSIVTTLQNNNYNNNKISPDLKSSER